MATHDDTTRTYTLRMPGMSAWAEGLTHADAVAELVAQQRAGQRLSVYRDSDGEEMLLVDGALVTGEEWEEVARG